MIYSQEKKFLYIHIPKTAGTSISAALKPYDTEFRKPIIAGLIEKVSRQNLRVFQNNWMGRLQSITQLYAGHQKLSDVHRIMPEDIYRNLFRFTFVRNPYAQVVSVFNFVRNCQGHHLHSLCVNYTSFAEFAKSGWRIPDYNQVDYLKNCHSKFDMNYVGRVEDIENDINNIRDKLNLSKSLIPHLNTSSAGNWKEDYDEETFEIVTKRYKKDLQFLGYDFHSYSNDRANLPIGTVVRPADYDVVIPL